MSKEFTDFLSKITTKDNGITLAIRIEKAADLMMAELIKVWSFAGLEENAERLSKIDNITKEKCKEVIFKIKTYKETGTEAIEGYRETIKTLMEMTEEPNMSNEELNELIDSTVVVLSSISQACNYAKQRAQEMVGEMLLITVDFMGRQMNKED